MLGGFRMKSKRVRSRNSRFVDEGGFPNPYEVRSFQDLLEYTRATDPSSTLPLDDPRVVAYLRRYYAFVASNELGDQPSWGEYAETENLAALLFDLTEGSDPQFTEYLATEAGPDYGNPEAKALLLERAGIQLAYGVIPDVVSFSKKGRR